MGALVHRPALTESFGHATLPAARGRRAISSISSGTCRLHLQEFIMTALHLVFRRFAQMLFLAAAAMPLPALAQTTLWKIASSGRNWSDPTKWTNGVPG